MRILLVSSFVVASLLALAVALVARSSSDPAKPDLAPRPPASVVYGPPEAPEGGELHVAILVPTPRSVRLTSLLAKSDLDAFLDAERSRAASASADAPVDDTQVEWGDSFREPAGDPPTLAEVRREVKKTTSVRVVFHRLLAAECSGMPIVLLPDEVSSWLESPWSLRLEREGSLPLSLALSAPVLIDACVDAIRTSSLVHRLAHDPLALLGAERHGDDVVVRLREAPDDATVRDVGDHAVAGVEVDRDGVLRFRCPDPGIDPRSHRLVARWKGDGLVLRRAWRVVDLVGTADRRVIASAAAEAGAPYAPRVLFEDSKTGQPVAGRRERLALVRDGKTLAEAVGTSDANGVLDAFLAVPEEMPTGLAELVVGEDRFPVLIKDGLRLSLVTDRSLYRPTDDVQARVMVHRGSTGRPVANENVTLKLGDVEKQVATSAHGIASATFHLLEERAGPRTLHASVRGEGTDVHFSVRAFETPSFTVDVTPDRVDARGGETVPVRIAARYVNGTPMVGASVLVQPSAEVPLDRPLSGVTDAAGDLPVAVRLPPTTRSGALMVVVADVDGRTVETALAVEVAGSDAPRLEVTPLEEPIVERPCRVEVRGPASRTVVLEGSGEPSRTLALDANGRAEVSLTPRFQAVVLSLRLAGGLSVERTIEAFRADDRKVLVVPARRTWAVGETFEADLLGRDGPSNVDLVRDGVTLRSLSVSLAAGRGRLALPLASDLAGVLEVRAWRLADEKPVGHRVGILVVRNRSLVVRAASERDAWRPGETAALTVSVADRAGRPAPGVLGYWGVDEALLALSPWRDGREEVFDVVPGTGLESHGPVAARVEHGDAVPFESARAVLGPPVPFDDLDLPIRHRAGPAREQRLLAETRACADARLTTMRRSVIEALRRTPIEEIGTAVSLREVLRSLVNTGRLDPSALADPWGTPVDVGEGRKSLVQRGYPDDEPEDWVWGVACTSAGPDLSFGTADDVPLTWIAPRASEIGGMLGRFLVLLAKHRREVRARWADPVVRDAESMGHAETDNDLPYQECYGASATTVECDYEEVFAGPVNNALIGIGGGAGGAFGGRGGSRDLRTGGGGRSRDPEPVHLRKDFSPALCFVPEAIVGPDGTARLEIPLKDSITTWRLRLVASAADGATGTGETRVRVTQPLHAEPWIATHLTVGDELDLPVAVRNETDASTTVTLRLTSSAEIESRDASTAQVVVGPNGTGAHVFRIRAVARGAARVRVDATSEHAADAVERIVAVRPDARELVETWNATLAPDRPWRLDLPAGVGAAPADHRLTLYPSPLVDVLGGLEGLLSCPHG